MRRSRVWAPLALLAAALCVTSPSYAQLDALLPYKDSVEQGAQLPIDGIYKISSTGTRIRLEGGRGYALDEWMQLIFMIRPNMVTMQNIKRVKAGHYTGYDLPLLSDATLTLQANGAIKVGVKTITGPSAFLLTPLAVSDPNGFNTERVAAGHRGPRLKIPPVGQPAQMSLGDTSRFGPNDPFNATQRQTKSGQRGAALAAQSGQAQAPPAMFLQPGQQSSTKNAQRSAEEKACVVVGRDPETNLTICDYPIQELN